MLRRETRETRETDAPDSMFDDDTCDPDVSERAERQTITFESASFAVVECGDFRFKSSTSQPVRDDHSKTHSTGIRPVSQAILVQKSPGSAPVACASIFCARNSLHRSAPAAHPWPPLTREAIQLHNPSVPHTATPARREKRVRSISG